MESTTPVTLPAPGTYRLRLPNTVRPIVVTLEATPAGHTLLRRGRRTVGVLAPSGYFEGRPWAREALAFIRAGGAHQVVRCQDCQAELRDPTSRQRGFGPDCWAARRRSA